MNRRSTKCLGRPDTLQKQRYSSVSSRFMADRNRYLTFARAIPRKMTQLVRIREAIQQRTILRRRDPCDRTGQSAQ